MPENVTTSPSTLTIKVQTRHTSACPHKADIYSKRCKCRKQLYIYEHGRDRTVSARTRSWAEAEKRAAQMIAERDPVNVQARLFDEERARAAQAEEEKRRQAEEARIPIVDAVQKWLSGRKPKSYSQAKMNKCMATKIESWAEETKITFLDEITPAMLYGWHGQWSLKANSRRDRLGVSTQNQYIIWLRHFFRWTVEVGLLLKDPSVIVKPQKYEHIQTQPLSSDHQFAEILAATYHMPAWPRRTQRSIEEYGRDLRAIFLLQRWVGLRIIDALTLERRSISICPLTGRTLLTLKTKKTGALIKDRPLPLEVVQALDQIPLNQKHVRPGYYFWSPSTKITRLTIQWTKIIRERLNPLVSLQDEDGRPMKFRSHMLRDTFAVELLIQGVSIEEVSELLTHTSIQVTQKYYAPWIKKRRQKLHDKMVAAMERMGAAFTPASVRPDPQPRLM